MSKPETSPPPMELPDGKVLGPYRIKRRLGRGGMGTVYQAEQIEDGRIVALKVLSVDLDQLNARTRFEREGRAAAAINHPNTVYVFRAEEIDGLPTICMEWVVDGTLEEQVIQRGPLPVDEVVEYAVNMIDGLAAAYDAGLLHRDVKPSNCFVAKDGLKVGDFGLAKPVDAGDQAKLTQSGVFLGTPVFSSPEQLLGNSLDSRSDMYAVGLTLYFALTAKLPFVLGSVTQVVANVLMAEPTPISRYRPDIPPKVAQVVMKAMLRLPAERYQSYDEFREAVVALRKSVVVPASITERLLAWGVDVALYFVLIVVAGISVEAGAEMLWGNGIKLLPATIFDLVLGTGNKLLRSNIFELCIILVFFVIPEGLRGQTLGKLLVGIQVVRRNQSVLGVPRAALRATLLHATWMVSHGINQIDLSFGTAAMLRLLLLVGALPRFGGLTLYDRLTGSRVVRALPKTLSRRRRSSTFIATQSAPALVEPYGPYFRIVEDTIVPGPLKGLDPALQRFVWMIPREQSPPLVSEARQTISRSTRLRWVSSGIVGNSRCDVYDAPSGEPFSVRIQRFVAGEQLLRWIHDLSGELVLSERENTMPVSSSVEQLWIDSGDGILVADTEVKSIDIASTTTQEPAAATGALVTNMVRAAQQSGNLQRMLPPFVTEAIDRALDATSVGAVAHAVEPVLGRTMLITRRYRQRTIFLPLVAITMMTISGLKLVDIRTQEPEFHSALFPSLASIADVRGAKVAALVSYYNDDIYPGERVADYLFRTSWPAPPEDTVQSGSWFERTCISMGVWKFPSNKEAAIETQFRQRALAGVYLASALADRVIDTVRSVTAVSGVQLSTAKRIVEAYSSAGESDKRAARELVEIVWHGWPPLDSSSVLLLFSIGQLWPWLACALLVSFAATLLFRRGASLRIFQLELIDRHGRRASRLRSLLRQLFLYVVVAIALTVNFVALMSTLTWYGSPLGTGIMIGSVVLLVAYIWHAIRHPERSLVDRIAGTYLVPG